MHHVGAWHARYAVHACLAQHAAQPEGSAGVDWQVRRGPRRCWRAGWQQAGTPGRHSQASGLTGLPSLRLRCAI
jgi:hypothetical protein